MTVRLTPRVATMLAAAALTALTGSLARAADAAAPPTTAPSVQPPTTRPVDPATQALIDQLGDADPAVREKATGKLREIGRGALPALQEAAKSDNPEVAGRARALVRHAQRKVPPAPPPAAGGRASKSVSVSVANGVRTTDVDDNGYKVKIRQDPTGITLDVTGVEDGKPVTETFAATDAETLKQAFPEAFALYEKYTKGGAGGVNIQVFGGGNGAAGRVQVGPARVAGPDAARLREMIRQMEQQLDRPEIPPEHRQRVLDQLRQMLDRAAPQPEAEPPIPPAPPADGHERALRELEEQRQRDLDAKREPLREPEPPAAEMKGKE